jgi:hypothetical protein
MRERRACAVGKENMGEENRKKGKDKKDGGMK